MSEITTSNLLSNVKLGNVTLTNRIAMAPMTRCRAIGNVPNELMATYYQQRNTAGLIITEGTSPSPNGLGYARIPGLYSDEQVEKWKNVTKAAKENGGEIFAQIMHTGRVSHIANMPEGARIIAPSAINAEGDMWVDALGMQKTGTPQEMTAEDIIQTKNEYVQSALNAVEAGFDGVELHSANGYLLEQFLNPHSNVRTDAYGGSVENRARFVLEVAKATGEAIGFDKVGIRLSPYGTFNNMPHYDEIVETYEYLTTELNKLNIAYIHVIDYAANQSEEGKGLIKFIRKNFNNVFILNGGYTKERAEAAIANNEADLISFGNPFISNPTLVDKIANNEAWVKVDGSLHYTADEKGYTDYL